MGRSHSTRAMQTRQRDFSMIFVFFWAAAVAYAGEPTPYYNENCPVPELSQQCQSICSEGLADCALACGNDEACRSQCIRKFDDCLNECPCYAKCFEGCDNCQNPVCDQSCSDPDNSTASLQCKHFVNMRYKECANTCDIDGTSECFDNCESSRAENMANCPCMQNCPNGCPCENWACECSSDEAIRNATQCENLVATEAATCGKDCVGEVDCINDCQNQYWNDIQNCPCHSNCIKGAETIALEGDFVFPNGDTYSGNYISGPNGILREGKGKWISKSGYVYDGEWSNDKINGQGYLKMPEGSEYRGQFVAGKFHGEGCYTWSDGSNYAGPFCDNKPEGDGVYNDTQTRQKWIGKFYPKGALQLKHVLNEQI